MEILQRIPVPTGDILIVKGDKGKLECLSLGDYGKAVNIKADFLDLDREPERVRHQALLPLEEKWVITISTQYGCSMGCSFCDVPRVGPGSNASTSDLFGQIEAGLSLHPEVARTDRLNIHFARMGEPTWNPNVIKCGLALQERLAARLPGSLIHPVVSTMMPRNNVGLEPFLVEWTSLIKNELFHGDAGLQLSINSTSDIERDDMFNWNQLSLVQISDMMARMPPPLGRKYTLNFAVAGYEIDAEYLAALFPPKRFIVKLTPMHKTRAATQNGIRTEGDYTQYHPYQVHEAELKAAGFDVLVFIASDQEDMSRITCGNAILSGTRPEEV
jgi:23S rRNA (adenine2503-C2)-methyltransferase